MQQLMLLKGGGALQAHKAGAESAGSISNRKATDTEGPMIIDVLSLQESSLQEKAGLWEAEQGIEGVV